MTAEGPTGVEGGFAYRHAEMLEGAGHFHGGGEDMAAVIALLRELLTGGMPYGNDEQGREFDKGYRSALGFLLGGEGEPGELLTIMRFMHDNGARLGLTSRNIAELDQEIRAELRRIDRRHE